MVIILDHSNDVRNCKCCKSFLNGLLNLPLQAKAGGFKSY